MYSPTPPAFDAEFKKWNLYVFNNTELILLFLFSLVSQIPIISGKILYKKRSFSSKDIFFVKLLIFTCRKLSSLPIYLLNNLSAEVDKQLIVWS